MSNTFSFSSTNSTMPVREILLRLPAASLLRFRAVCKQWRAVIDDPCFAKAHIENQHSSSNSIIIRTWVGPPFYPLYYFNLEDLDFRNAQQTIPVTPLQLSRGGLNRVRSLPVSACNGLMLFLTKHEKTGKVSLEIRNALTGERLKLPDPNVKDFKVLGAGLGYDCIADDYKVVVIDYDGKSLRRTHVYSLKSDSWRIVRDCPYGFECPDIQHGSFLNGSLHWVSSDGIIVAFDFATENYRKLALPVFHKPPKSIQLDALDGCLFLSCILEEGKKLNRREYFDSWVMNDKQKYFEAWVMNEYGAEDSWIKLFSLKEYYFSFDRNSIRPVAYMKSKNQVLMQYEDSIIWFDIQSNSVKLVEVHGFCEYKIYAQICVGSLFRLHDSCGRVASETRTTKRGAIKKADTKLTFCVRDYEPVARRKAPALHDNCYNIDSNWFSYSCQGDEIQTASPNPGSDSSIPLDICREIFLHLPAKSLIRFRAVCKVYRAIIDEPCFVKAHTNNHPSGNTILIKNSSGPPFYPLYSFDLDSLNFTYDLELIPATPLGFTHSGLSYRSASVCNGLILFSGKKWEIWNPLTNECLQLPRGEFNSDVTASGFGYDNTNDDYKVVVVDRFPRLELKDEDENENENENENEVCVYQTHVYSLRSDSWRMIGNFPTDVDEYWVSPILPGVALCGALHWTTSHGLNNIVVLNLRTEKYSQLQYPTLRSRYSIVDITRYVEVLGGCLVMIDFVIAYGGGDDYMDVWVMKEYGAEDSWINAFSINDEYVCFSRNIRPVAFMKDESQILLQDDKGLILFDEENDCMQKINIHGFNRCLYARAFSGSIFRLHDNCGVSGSESESGILRTKRSRISKRHTEISDTELYLCVRDVSSWYECDSHVNCHRLDSNWCYLSSDEDEEEQDGDEEIEKQKDER